MDYNRDPSPADVSMKLMGLRVRSVNVEDNMRWTMMEFNRRWRNAAADRTIRIRKYGEGSAGAEDAADYTEAKRQELWEMYQSFRSDMATLGVSEEKLASAEKEKRVPMALRSEKQPETD